MVTRIFTHHDTDLYASWHAEEGGTVTVYVPGVGGVRMSLAKAEDLGRQLTRQAEYGRQAAQVQVCR